MSRQRYEHQIALRLLALAILGVDGIEARAALRHGMQVALTFCAWSPSSLACTVVGAVAAAEHLLTPDSRAEVGQLIEKADADISAANAATARVIGRARRT